MIRMEEQVKKIELLAPAGSFEQALMCIESGCDALYGGLKSWNARMNARNFSIDEYKRLISVCHTHNVKFYMTLNTMFTDAELDEIIRMFSDDNFVLPDAVIAADMGFISVMATKFPSVDIHVSTQFGVTSVRDIDFLKSYNVKRVILARELTLNDIQKMKADSDIQLEVFVYGSQCICFSGQCLWGGLTQERSGNRGRCPATCRDFYECNGIAGQLLYPQDIDASGMIKQLTAVGVDSVKIEGRFRNSEQIAAIVRNFRNAIDNDSNNIKISTGTKEDFYAGYLENRLPAHKMLNVLNPRTAMIEIPDCRYGNHDFITEVDPQYGIRVIAGDKENSDKLEKRYVKTIFSEPLCNMNDGAVLTLFFKDTVLEKIDVINNIGVQNTYFFVQNETRTYTVSDVVSILRANIKIKLFDISSNMPEFSKVECNFDEMLRMIAQINRDVEISPRPVIDKIDSPKYSDFLQMNKAEMVREMKSKGFHNFIFNIQSMDNLIEVIKYEDENDNIIYKLPLLDFNNRIDVILSYLKDRNIMVSCWSQLLSAENVRPKKIYADYTLNAWNSASISILADYGVDTYIAHPETHIVQNMKMAGNTGVSVAVLYLSRIPIGYTRACFGEVGVCDKNCGNTEFEMENITKKYKIHIFCNNEWGYRTLTTSFINAAYGELDQCRRIFDFSQLSDDEIRLALAGELGNHADIVTVYGRNVL